MPARTVIVTGASLGIGAAVSRRFFATGANVVLVARKPEPLAELAAELASEAGDPDRIQVCSLDVTDVAGCEAMLAEAAKRFGSVDVLVNNAGYHERGSVDEIDAAAIARMIEVNLTAPLVLTRLALPYLQRAGQAAVINVGSLAGRTTVPGSAVYSATKFGLRAFTFALNEELRGTGVKIAVVSPGPIDTGFIMDDIDNVSDLTFSQPISTAEEVAEAVLGLCDGGTVEVPMPRISGYLTTISYLFPTIGRALRPALERRGRRTKERLKAQRGQAGQG